MTSMPFRNPSRFRRAILALAAVLAFLFTALQLRADEPYARNRDYHLQHSKIVLRFDLDQRKVIGDVTHTVSILKDGTSTIVFDSVGLTIHSVSINRAPSKFESTADKLIIPLGTVAHEGEKFDIEIHYDGKPTKGLYFILPDKDYPNRPKQVWTQGESEDTRYYLPTYDYPNNRLTTETVITVPASWTTVANGKLINVSNASDDMKTWTWRESQPSSTYLITVVAGEFDELKQSWRKMPVTYYAPKGRGDRLAANYERTPAMIELFSSKLGVDYPWEKYSQSMVDDFVAGGMENSSATTNTSSSLRHPKLVPEYLGDEDDLISHELAHQWFGDLVTCKDWGDVWLNEGFATFFETVWNESRFPKDDIDYDRWNAIRQWFGDSNLYDKPIVRHDFDSGEFDGNAYGKGGLVLDMLRHQIGEDAFFASLKRYLETNRGKNVVTHDLLKAFEETTHRDADVDLFFNQWLYGAGAPKFDVSYKYDDAKHQLALTVKQTQKIEGHVGLFRVPVDVEVTTAAGSKVFPIDVTKESETFSLPADSAPRMVLFDKGSHLLASVDMHQEQSEWLYQLKNATDVPDRADAIVVLGKPKAGPEIVSALAAALNSDKAWGVRITAAEALGRIATDAASKELLASLDTNTQPWVRTRIVSALGGFKDNAEVSAKLDAIAKDDSSYRARASALQTIARLKSPAAFATLTAAVNSDSPDDILRNAALRSFGFLGDDKAVPLLREWSVAGKRIESRQAAIGSLARLDKNNKEITQQIASYLNESHFPVRLAAIFALGTRGDASAVPALETLLKSNDLSIEMVPMIKGQIARLQQPGTGAGNRRRGANGATGSENSGEESRSADEAKAREEALAHRLDHLEHLIELMTDQLKSMESRLPPAKQ